ncbi:HNH endonuclease signature motif containing protein [Hoyosella altamirensis]|uniref:DUF222 domain-containing protein n=1 Tax=Hoyosella altamirensis TaxID=616997 RepID=A0A839RKZ3_9ACTN|nr:HNH endonuclease signature motif containing protein [Hoyosella altamirensis]MBB3036888.1 hypothetical protein [Hoyosella altamirensis]
MHVILTDTALTGQDHTTPAYLDGYGIIDSALAREIAAHAVIRPLTPSQTHPAVPADPPVLSDPVPSEPACPGDAALTYRPSRQIADQARAEHGTCQWPHCDRAAWECDLDHHDPFNHAAPEAGGRTVTANLGPLCRGHHRIKTFCGWTFTPGSHNTMVLHAPSGLTYTLYKSGPVELLTGTPPAFPAPHTAPAQLARKTRTRTQHRTARVRTERGINHATRCQNTTGTEPPF